MSFANFPTIAVVAGVVGLAVLLWLIQRLRVQHRQVEVLSTLFWQAAIEETRARVFVRRFRHWPAWLLLVAIASLLWMLLAGPQVESFDSTQHIVLVDWSVEDPEARGEDLQLAIDHASSLPIGSREIVAVGNHVETLLSAGEPAKFARLRGEGKTSAGPQRIGWAIASLSARATADRPVVLHLVGDAALDRWRLQSLGDNVTVNRIARQSTPKRFGLSTLGVASSSSGQWETVDVWFTTAGDDSIDTSDLALTVNQSPLTQSITPRGPQSFVVADVPAKGGILAIQNAGRTLGEITLPNQEAIRVSLDASVPESLRQLITVEDSLRVVSTDADVTIGSGDESNFRLTGSDESAFQIETDQEDPQRALGEIVDTLALRQIDATAIADQSGQVVDVQMKSGPQRSIAVWSSLFSPAYDFRESRACPIFVSRSIHWLANKPPLVPWVQQGERLPVAAPEFDRVTKAVATTSDGRELRAARMVPNIVDAAAIADSPQPNLFFRVGISSWLGLLVVGLLVGEWILFQRGRMP